MKTVITFLLGAVIGLAGVYLYHKVGPQGANPPYVVDFNIQNGQRVPLKDPSDVGAFEKQLQTVDPDGKNGTDVDIKATCEEKEVEGPGAGGAFNPPPKLIGPKGSIHITQKVTASNLDDLNSVLNFLATQTPTPCP